MCTENKIVNYANRLLSIFVPMLEHVLEFLAKKMVEQSIEFTKKNIVSINGMTIISG